MELTDRIFVNLGGGYQLGFQTRTDDEREHGREDEDVRTCDESGASRSASAGSSSRISRAG